MGNMKKHMWIKIIPVVLVLAFIWGNSMLPATISSAESGRFEQWFRQLFTALQSFLSNCGIELTMDTLVRKCAHVTEYAVLGVLSAVLFLRAGRVRFHWAALLCLAAAAADETIQIFSDGRGPRVTDVCIDFGGALCGICLVLIITAAKQKRERKKRSRNG